MRRLLLAASLLLFMLFTGTAQAVAPVLSASGEVLEWTKNGATEYRLERCEVSPEKCTRPGWFYLIKSPGTACTGEKCVLDTSSFVSAEARPATIEWRVQKNGETQPWSNIETVSYPAASSPYLSKSGTSITLEGTAQRQLGYNDGGMGSTGPNCGGRSKAEAESIYSAVAANSKANVLRVFFTQRWNKTTKAIDFGPADQAVEVAKKYGVKVVPVIADNWTACEGGITHEHFLPWWQTGYTEEEGKFTGQEQPLSYKAYAEKFAAHFKEEPTIAWYQLANEPDARNSSGTCTETSAKEALRNFADTMTTAIKKEDSNHMVDLGAISWCGGMGSDYGYVSAGNVDLCDAYHDYTKGTEAISSTFKAQLEQCVITDKKPTFIGEAGVCSYVDTSGNCAKPPPTLTAASLERRANDFKAKMEAAFSNGAVGYMIWSTGKECSEAVESKIWVVGSHNSNAGCPVSEQDPTEAVMAGFKSP